MAWTEKQKKAHSNRMKAMWAKKAEAKEVKTIVDTIAEQDRVKAHAPKDMVNAPPHYTFGKFEVIDVLEDWFPKNPLLWQVGKYIARAEHKGNALQDLEKARFYLDRKINQLKEKQHAQDIS